jgi:CRP-like cAMP-binding protein
MISPELLRRYPFFNFMDDTQLNAVAMITEETTYKKDELLIEAGKSANQLYFLIEGSVAYFYHVTTENDPYYNKDYYISSINPGEIFGISALIEPYIFTATMRTEKASRIIQINAQALRALCEVDLRLSAGLSRAVAKAAMERLQLTRIQLIATKS